MGVVESARGKEFYQALCKVYERLTRDLEKASPRARVRRRYWGERHLAELLERFGKS